MAAKAPPPVDVESLGAPGSRADSESAAWTPGPESVGGHKAEVENMKAALPDFFIKVRKLGEGSQGKVYLVYAKKRDKFFALKVVSKAALLRLRKIPRVLTEREILATVEHPFVVPFYGSFQTDKYLYFVMEYCPGGEFYKLIQKQPGKRIPESAARLYTAEVVIALEYLHSQGVVMRDLKPENILVDARGHLKLADFDLSKMLTVDCASKPGSSSAAGESMGDELLSGISALKSFLPGMGSGAPKKPANPSVVPLGRLNSFVGTMEYMAPEVIQGMGYKASVDWWTLGILVYEMVIGHTPFVASSQTATFSNICSSDVEFPSSPALSSECKSLIRGLLKHKPEQRLGHKYGAAEIKEHAWLRGVDWAHLRQHKPYMVPDVQPLDPSTLSDLPPDDDEFTGELAKPRGIWANFANAPGKSLEGGVKYVDLSKYT